MRALSALSGFSLVILSVLFWRMGPLAFGGPFLSALSVSIRPPHLPQASPLWLAGIGMGLVSILILRWAIPAFKLIHLTDPFFADPIKLSKHIVIAALCLGGFVTIWFIERSKLLNNYLVVVGFFALIIAAAISFWGLNKPRSCVTNKLNSTEWAFIVLGTLAFGALYAFDLNSWRYSFIGDEYIFLTTARRMWSSETPFIPWLEACGVYCGFPFITTLYQTAHLLIFGDNNFGWRMSAVTATALCIAPAYIFLKGMARYCAAKPALVASLACVLLFSVEPIQIWAKIGKPHAFFLPPIFFSLGALTFAQNSGRLGIYGIAGLLAGLGMFFSPVGPSLAFASVGICQAHYSAQRYIGKSSPNLMKDLIIPLWLFLLGSVLGGAPIFVQFDYFESMSRLNLESSEAIANRAYFARRTIQALLAFLWSNTNGHFMIGNPFNFILGAFTLSALCARGRSALLTLAATLLLLAVFAITVGGMSQYGEPPPSRIHLLAIPFSILSAIGLGHLTQQNKGVVLRGLVIALVLAAIPLSYGKIALYNPYVHPLNRTASAIRAVQAAGGEAVIVLTSGENPLIRQVLNYIANPRDTKVYERVDAMSSDELGRIFQSAPENASFVITEDLSLDNIPEFKRFAGRIYPYKIWSVPERPTLSPFLEKLVKIINGVSVR